MLKEIELNDIIYTVVDIKKSRVWDYVKKTRKKGSKKSFWDKFKTKKKSGYIVLYNIAYFSERFGKWVGVEKGDRSDGATYAKDINSFGWLFHDELKVCKTFEDGTTCTNWQASVILGDLLALQGRWFRRYTWLSTTYVFGEVKSLFSRLF